MKIIRRYLAAAEILLIFPATLFLMALFVRNLQPQQFEPAHTAQRIVEWYAARTHLGLWLFMMAFPLAVLIIGSVALARSWKRDAALREASAQVWHAMRTHFATLLIAVATVTAGGILAAVALHLITD